MEQQIKDYELQVETIVKKWHKLGARQKQGWRRYHREMIKDFQHERAIHLAITLFFAGLALVMLGVLAWALAISDYYWAGVWPILAVALILVVLTGFYVKHYYFLENHIQKLYKYNLEFCLENKA